MSRAGVAARMLLLVALAGAWWDWRVREERRAAIEEARLVWEVRVADMACQMAWLVGGDG